MGADWVAFLEAAYAPAADDATWGERILDAAAPIFDRPRSAIGLNAVRVAFDASTATIVLSVGEVFRQIVGEEDALLGALGPDGLRHFYLVPPLTATIRGRARAMPPTTAAVIEGFRERFAIEDAIGINTRPQPGVVLTLAATSNTRVSLARRQHRLLSQIGLHLETAFRLRQQPETLLGVISSAGKILHREDPKLESAELARHVDRVERARTRRTRRDPEAIDLWHALAAGRLCLAERTEGTRRHYLVLENAPARPSSQAFTKRELDVVSCAARGLSTKLIAYGLGLSASVVSMELATAATKVGLATRAELVRLAAILTHDPSAGFDEATFTMSERDVLELLRQGLSNREIAAMRGRSIRTIANQVASLLRKSGRASRRGLVASS